MGITISNIVKTPLNINLDNFDYNLNAPGVTRIETVKGSNYSYKVIAVAYIPQGLGNPLPISSYNETYNFTENGISTPFIGANSISIDGTQNDTSLAIVCFDAIEVNGANTTAFALAFSSPTTNKDKFTTVAISFDYVLEGGVQDTAPVFFAQADEDPRIGRGGISEGSSPD